MVIFLEMHAGTTMYEIRLNQALKKAEEDYALYINMGWSVDGLKEWRHMLLKELLRVQLKKFDRGG